MERKEKRPMAKKAYSPPKLTAYGSIASMTRGNVSGAVDGGATKQLQLRPDAETEGVREPAVAGPNGRSPW
jgi:hypothetical protein